MAFSKAQKKSLLVGFGLLLAASAFIILIWLGSFLPGFAGELFSMLASIMWTPVLLDITLFIFGLGLILWLNKVRLERAGDEFVYLEQVEGPEIPTDLPVEARSAVFDTAPDKLGDQPTLAAIEGALALNDLTEATELLLSLPSDALSTTKVLALRIELLRRQEKNKEAAELLAQLRLKSPSHPLVLEKPEQDH